MTNETQTDRLAEVLEKLAAIREVVREAHFALDDSEDQSHLDPPVNAVPRDNANRLDTALSACETFMPDGEAWHGPGPLVTQVMDSLQTLSTDLDKAQQRIAELEGELKLWDMPIDDEALVERAAWSIIDGSAGERAANHAREFCTANWSDALRSARAILPLIREARIAAEARAEKLVDWQPIETAPHGRPVLLAWQDWRDGKWIMDVGPASTGERNEVASSISHHGSATQWMPLPAAPALSEHAGEE